MNNRQAQFILSAFRPGGQDATDPQFAEALEQARSDPTLTSWLSAQVAFDRNFADALQSVIPPHDLRPRILAGGAASQPRPTFRRMPFLALAASIAVMALVAGYVLRGKSEASLRPWQAAALAFVSTNHDAPKLDHLVPGIAELHAWLQERNAPMASNLPAGLTQSELLGCKILKIQEQTVTIICFRQTDGRLVHLAVADRSALPGGAATPWFQQSGRWATVSWVEGSRSYMLATLGGEATVRQFL